MGTRRHPKSRVPMFKHFESPVNVSATTPADFQVGYMSQSSHGSSGKQSTSSEHTGPGLDRSRSRLLRDDMDVTTVHMNRLHWMTRHGRPGKGVWSLLGPTSSIIPPSLVYTKHEKKNLLGPFHYWVVKQRNWRKCGPFGARSSFYGGCVQGVRP